MGLRITISDKPAAGERQGDEACYPAGSAKERAARKRSSFNDATRRIERGLRSQIAAQEADAKRRQSGEG